MDCAVVGLLPPSLKRQSLPATESPSTEHVHASLKWIQETYRSLRENDEMMTRFIPPIPLQDCTADYLANALSQNHTITEIELKHPDLSQNGMAVLLEAALLTPFSAIKTIRIISPQRKAISSSVIFDTILAPQCCAVETVDISSDVMGVTCAKQLGQILASDSIHLVELRLTNYDWIHRSLALTQILNGLRCNGSLQVFSLSGSQINDTVAVALAAVIEKHPTLQELDLNDNKIGDTGLMVLAAALVAQWRHFLSHKQLEQRKTLAMSYKGSTTSSTSTDSTSSTSSSSSSSLNIVNRSCLRTLKLSWNEVGDKGIKALAEQLPYIKELETIELFHNPRITKSGLRSLLNGLKRSTHVHHIMLSYEQREVDRNVTDEIEYLCQLHRLRAHRTKYSY
jgi:Ran GTPase-activating protein (RanGAP) involved in mRNA processing and transport